MCGEKSMYDYGNNTAQGSPPRMRGKGSFVLLLGELIRITPAYAGKRWYTRCAKKLPPDHPRTCGEKENAEAMRVQFQGSPPRMRGKDFLQGLHSFRDGITPACAGKRKTQGRFSSTSRDHPRMCGEKANDYTLYKVAKGSPPRMRGKVHKEVCNKLRLGITPAYAGKRRRR